MVYTSGMNTLIIDVLPPALDPEYVTITDATTPPDLTDKDTCPKGAVWQVVSEGYWLLRKRESDGRFTVALFQIRHKVSTEKDIYTGVFWLQDRYGWQYMDIATFDLGAWTKERVSVAFSKEEGEVVLSSVRVLRPCKKS